MARFAFLSKYKDEIGSATALLGLLVSMSGFAITITQLIGTKQALQAANMYQIQKDARELVDTIAASAEMRKLVSGEALDLIETNVVRTSLWRMNNFYLGVFRQSTSNGLPDAFVESMASDYCRFVKNEKVSDQLDAMTSDGMIGDTQELLEEEWCVRKD